MPDSPPDSAGQLSPDLALGASARADQPGPEKTQPLSGKGESSGGSSLASRLVAIWKGFSSFVLTFGGVALVGALVFLLGQQLTHRAGEHRSISVPESLSKSGYTDQVAAARLRDAIRGVIEGAATAMHGSDVSLHSESPDIVVPKLGIPFNAVAQLARTLLGSHRWHIVSGEFVERGQAPLASASTRRPRILRRAGRRRSQSPRRRRRSRQLLRSWLRPHPILRPPITLIEILTVPARSRFISRLSLQRAI